MAGIQPARPGSLRILNLHKDQRRIGKNWHTHRQAISPLDLLLTYNTRNPLVITSRCESKPTAPRVLIQFTLYLAAPLAAGHTNGELRV